MAGESDIVIKIVEETPIHMEFVETGPPGPPGPVSVTSVNGQTGDVLLDASDVGADPTGSAAQAESNANSYTDAEIAAIDFPVDSVFGRTGDVVAMLNDYAAILIEFDLTLFDVLYPSETVDPNAQAIIDFLINAQNELEGDLQDVIADYQLRSEKGQANGYASLDSGGKVPVAQLPASIMQYQGTWNASTNTPTLVNGVGDAGDVYIVSVAGTHDFGAGNISFEIGDWVIYNGTIWQKSDMSDAVSSVFGRQGAVTAQNGDYNASQITNTPAGTVSAITVQAAIDELDSEKVPTTRTVNGKPLSANVTLNTDDVAEGTTNLYLTTKRVEDISIPLIIALG